MNEPYFFFQPLFDAQLHWVGLNLRAKSADQCTAADYARCFANSAISTTPGHIQIILASDPAWFSFPELMHGFARERTVFAVPSDAREAAGVVDACVGLRSQGTHLALCVKPSSPLQHINPKAFDYLLFDASTAQTSFGMLDLMGAQRQGFKLVATGVTSHALKEWLIDCDFNLFSGEFAVIADTRSTRKADTSRLKLLKMLSLVVQDADTSEIEPIFREEPKLSYNLLRLVNSVGIGGTIRINSFNQAITVLGRRQLQRWLQLLIYANQYGNSQEGDPLLQIAAARGRQMELISAELGVPGEATVRAEAAFMIGIFSLLDVLLGMSMAEILASLPLSDVVAQALETRSGPLGELLTAVIAAETGDLEGAVNVLQRLNISPATHGKAQVEALCWAREISAS